MLHLEWAIPCITFDSISRTWWVMVGVRTFKNQQKCVFVVESPSNTCTSQMRLAHIQWCPSAACRTRPHGENPSRHLYALWNRASGMSSRYVWHVFIICTVHMHLSIVTTSFHSNNMCINCWEFMCWPTPEEWIAIPAKKKHPLFGSVWVPLQVGIACCCMFDVFPVDTQSDMQKGVYGIILHHTHVIQTYSQE